MACQKRFPLEWSFLKIVSIWVTLFPKWHLKNCFNYAQNDISKIVSVGVKLLSKMTSQRLFQLKWSYYKNISTKIIPKPSKTEVIITKIPRNGSSVQWNKWITILPNWHSTFSWWICYVRDFVEFKRTPWEPDAKHFWSGGWFSWGQGFKATRKDCTKIE